MADVGYGGSFDMSRYFVGGFTSTAAADNITFTADSGQTLEFVNAVQVNDFRLRFKVPAAQNRYSAVELWLTDSADGNIAIKLTYTRRGAGSSTLSVNDGYAYTVTADFFGGADYFEANYSGATRQVAIGTNRAVEVSTDSEGQPFGGFPSGKAYLMIKLCDVTGDAGITLYNINNQTLSSGRYDMMPPEITRTTARGDRKLGDVVTIVPAYACDVLDPAITFVMYVNAPGGGYAVAEDGTVLDETTDPSRAYSLKLSEYGRYTVSYRAKDASGREAFYSYVYTVADSEPPTLELSAHAQTAAVGDTVLIAAARATDNVSETCTVVTYLQTPDGKLIAINGNSFNAAVAGTYRVWYYVSDTAGNVAYFSYQVVVA